MADEWQTVPNRQPRRAPRGRGRGQFRSQSRSATQQEDGWRSARQTSRSRSRVPARSNQQTQPKQQQSGDAFKLQTSNMFELHVGKSSRARKNQELQGFFELQDSSSEEEAFDAIDDDDLDVSDYESEDNQETTEFPPVPIDVTCSLCSAEKQPRFSCAAELSRHLRTVHHLAFRNLPHMMLFLQRYLDAWARELQTHDVKTLALAQEEDGTVVYYIDAAKCSRDRELREQAQRSQLQEILKAQGSERRNEAQEPRKCLFCKLVCADRAELFRHGYREHSFNIGLPDNLVHVNEFLEILEGRLNAQQCLYCEKTFTSPVVLRKHMRKKKHFKISSHNRLYDRFYVVNYLRPKNGWDPAEPESAAQSESEAEKDRWSDWSERADLPVRSLFDSHVAASADECWSYMLSEYGFDIHKLREDHKLGFHKTVMLINCIRRASRQNMCFACGSKLAGSDALAAHMKQMGSAHLQPPPADDSVWKDDSLMRPVLENDPLLMAFDDDNDAADEHVSQQRLEESKRLLREKLAQMSFDSSNKPDSVKAAAPTA
ncbi:hypothetical protein IWW36_000652 [Coemansia brasiliensis]|uniref:C2H2-type domain-containing protein n=1 Tax=Coemansia brasiliensis TaxID=2650707 RepID=A0A9W8IH51_9FUNG|nr:hypothetical protein IWW36_000652 [Coemansia brasiliensis]